MIYSIEMFAGKCDRCNAEIMKNLDYSCLENKEMIHQEMFYANWLLKDNEHYCPDCFTVNDNDEYVILPKNK